jgi:hypothetical protein
VGLWDVKTVKQGYSIIGHIIQSVRWLDFLAPKELPEYFRKIGYTGFSEFRGEADIPIIKADDIVAAGSEIFAEIGIPMYHVCP